MNSITRRRFLSGSAQTAAASLFLAQHSWAHTKELGTKANSDSDPTSSALVKLDEFIVRHLKETGAPGLTLSVADRQQTLKIGTYGFADTKAAQRLRPATMFEIGSISKSFVAITLLQLREEGKLDLNKPIVEYLPWLKNLVKF